MRHALPLTWLAPVALLALLARPALADSDEEASKKVSKQHYLEGMKHYNVSEYSDALESFKKGYFARPDPVFLFNLGQCHRMLGDPGGALKQYRAYLREKPDASNREAVERFITDAEEELSRRNAAKPPTGIQPPGDKPEQPDKTATEKIDKSDKIEVTSGVEKPAVKPRRTWMWGVIGAGAAVLVVGAAVGVGVGVAFTVPANAAGRSGTDPSWSIP